MRSLYRNESRRHPRPGFVPIYIPMDVYIGFSNASELSIIRVACLQASCSVDCHLSVSMFVPPPPQIAPVLPIRTRHRQQTHSTVHSTGQLALHAVALGIINSLVAPPSFCHLYVRLDCIIPCAKQAASAARGAEPLCIEQKRGLHMLEFSCILRFVLHS